LHHSPVNVPGFINPPHPEIKKTGNSGNLKDRFKYHIMRKPVQMKPQRIIEPAIQDFISRILRHDGSSIVRIVLFGSLARGENVEESDVDLLVVIKEKDPKLLRIISDTGFDILLDYECDISPKTYSVKEEKRQKELQTPFFREIEKDGVVLYEASGNQQAQILKEQKTKERDTPWSRT